MFDDEFDFEGDGLDEEAFESMLGEMTEEEKKEMADAFLDALVGFIETCIGKSIKRTEADNFKIDTAEVHGMKWKYETAIAHKDFNDGHWIILHGFDSKKMAEKYHDKMVEKYTNEEPTFIMDYFDNTIYLKDTKES